MPIEVRETAIAVREAKQYIHDLIRDDWNFEPSHSTSSPPAGARSSNSLPLPPQQILEWRAREYDSSASELEPPLRIPVVDKLKPQSSTKKLNISNNNKPAAEQGAAATSANTVKRRRRRRWRLEEEMRWNEGLRTWIERRDAWTGAMTRRRNVDTEEKKDEEGNPIPAKDKGREDGPASAETDALVGGAEDKMKQTREENAPGSARGKDDGGNDAGSASRSVVSWSSSSSGSHVHLHQEVNSDDCPIPDDHAVSDGLEEKPESGNQQGVHNKESTETKVTEPDSGSDSQDDADNDAGDDQDDDQDDPNEPLVPVAPPLLPSNAVRASINPSVYPSIYSKIVVQGLSPTVPINLADLTRAMVQGWKSDGQWPPKSSAPIPSDRVFAVRKKGVGAGADSSPAQTTPGSVDGHTRRRSSVVNAMRKVLHFSGIHARPFHRRGSTHESAAPEIPLADTPDRPDGG